MAPNIDVSDSFLCWEDDTALFEVGHIVEDGCEEEEIEEEQEDLGDIDEAIYALLKKEKSHMPRSDYWQRYNDGELNANARQKSVDWLLHVHAYFNFRPLTLLLSINYLDRFLSLHQMPEGKMWMYQLLSVTCLSLAAKMEETQVPLLLDLQIEGLEFMFEPRTIQRMELTVLSVLDWRLSSITSLSFLDHLILKTRLPTHGQLHSQVFGRVEEILVYCHADLDFLQFSPSIISSSALLCAMEEISPAMYLDNLKSYLSTLALLEGSLQSCVQSMKELLMDSFMNRVNKRKIRGGLLYPPYSPVRVLEASFSYDNESCTLFGSLESSIIITATSPTTTTTTTTSKKRKETHKFFTTLNMMPSSETLE